MVSIIIPVYNVKEYLRKCVESVMNQSLKDIEIILVDDGSMDGSSEMCDEFAKYDKRIRVIHQVNGGSTKARNAGLLIARGEYIGFVDSDDWIEPNMYSELLSCCVENNADIVISLKYINHKESEYRENLVVPEGIYDSENLRKIIIRNLIYSEDYQSKGISPNLYDKLFRKDLLFKYQFSVNERTKFGEDDVCVYSCLINAKRVVMLDSAYYHYRQREGSVCHSSDDMYFERITWFYKHLKEAFQNHPSKECLMEQLNRYMLEFVIRGINKQFGFGYGVVVPFYLPPYEILKSRNLQNIVLYGAGYVGQNYFRSLQLSGNIQIVMWVDKQYEDYRKQNLMVENPLNISLAEYDAVLIAVRSRELADKIYLDLIEFGIEKDKIIYESPKRIFQDIRRQ